MVIMVRNQEKRPAEFGSDHFLTFSHFSPPHSMLRLLSKRSGSLTGSLSKASSAVSVPLLCSIINDPPCANTNAGNAAQGQAQGQRNLGHGSRRAMSRMRPPPPPGGASGGPPHRFKCPKCQSFLSYTKSDVAEVRGGARAKRALGG